MRLEYIRREGQVQIDAAAPSFYIDVVSERLAQLRACEEKWGEFKTRTPSPRAQCLKDAEKY